MKKLYVILLLACGGLLSLTLAHAAPVDTAQARKALSQAVVYRNHGWTDSALSATARAADIFYRAAEKLHRPKQEALRVYLIGRSVEVESQLAESLYALGRYEELAQRMQRLAPWADSAALSDLHRERLYGWMARIWLELDSLDLAQHCSLQAERLYRTRTREEGRVFQLTADTLSLESTRWYRQRSFAFHPATVEDSIFLAERPILQYARPSWASEKPREITFLFEVSPDGEVKDVRELRPNKRTRRVPARRAAATCLYKWRFLPDPAADQSHELTLSFRFDRP